uniref:Protein kinase domain-containing protein n=1 Tax=Oryza barthii TaxID=65489 RepID=A0A0D3FT54_9ORYZ
MAGISQLLLRESTITITITTTTNIPDKCGNVSIPYPFGIGRGCYLDLPGSGSFSITCNHKTDPPQPYTADALLVLNITLETAEMFVVSAGALAVVKYPSVRARSAITSKFITTTQQEEEHSMQVKVTVGMPVTQQVNMTFLPSGYTLSAPYRLSPTGNMFTALGCVTMAKLYGSVENSSSSSSTGATTTTAAAAGGQMIGERAYAYDAGCITYCPSLSDAAADGAPCKGLGCCESSITPGLTQFAVGWGRWPGASDDDYGELDPEQYYQYAFVAQKDWYTFKQDHLTHWDIDNISVPFVLHWDIKDGPACRPETNYDSPFGACHSNHSKCANVTSGLDGYFCKCSEGYIGNPYIPDGCKDVNECENKSICGAGSTCKNTEGRYRCDCNFGQRRDNSSDNMGNCEPIFSRAAIAVIATVFIIALLVVLLMFILLERKKRKLRAYFNRNGGQLLKSIKIDIYTKEKLDQITKNYSTIIGKGGFGKVYMGTINGNVRVAVKGCITVSEARQRDFANKITIQSQIKTDVPMLVYEFIPRGSLCDVLHGKEYNKKHPLSLLARLDIAINSADALAYMHSYASQKILHGDVKSGNILLDDNFVPKVSDFGTSRLMTIGKDHTTFVVGDMSYIDPVYMKTGLLTEKSDVYSFGIVLLELMTGKKARYNGNNSLPMNFMEAYMTESRAYEMYDKEITTTEEDIKCTANVGTIAVNCLKNSVDERPAMTEVVKDLQIVRSEWLHILGHREHDSAEPMGI